MTPSATDNAALAAARSHLQATHAALAAALRQESGAGVQAERGADGAQPGAGKLLQHSLVLQLAEHAVAPWAEQRPWTLMALSAAGGALLASRRGRGLLGSLAMAALLAPARTRPGLQPLVAGLALLLGRPTGPRR